MRKLPIDRETGFGMIVALAAATLIVAALWPVFKRLVNAIANLYFERTTLKKVSQLRGAAPQQVRVRQTDLVGRMTAQDRALFRQAEMLLAQKRIVEGAQILEAIKFQRRAIDELEKGGFIDEACGVLIRMKVPHRAAVIYERNGMLEKAASCFTQANQHEAAGNVYLKLARQDMTNIVKAAEAFERGGKTQSAIQAFATVLATDRVIGIAQSAKAYDLLAAYMADRATAREVLARMTPGNVGAMLAEIELTPRHVRLMAQWTREDAGLGLTKTVLDRTAADAALARHFWTALTEAERQALSLDLPSLGLSSEAYAQHSLAVEALTQKSA